MVKKLYCIVCGNLIKLPLPDVGPDNYEGHVFCHECNLLLDIKSEASKIKYRVVRNQTINVIKKVSLTYELEKPKGETKES